MPPPSPPLTTALRHYLGRMLRETGQALDRVGLRGEAATQSWTSNPATVLTSGADRSKINNENWAAQQEPLLFNGHLSRHRTQMPLFKAGSPQVSSSVSFVAPCSSLIGSVTVGSGASVWYGAVVRGDGFIKKQEMDMGKVYER